MPSNILLALANVNAEKAYSKKLAELSPEFYVAQSLVAQDSIVEYLESNVINVLVYREGAVSGKTDDFEYIIGLKLNYPNLRIVFIAGDRTPGDKSLASLVSYQIFDILTGNSIGLEDIVERTVKPATWADASIYLPKKHLGSTIFSEEELSEANGRKQSRSQDVDMTSSEVMGDLPDSGQPKIKQMGMSLVDKIQKTIPGNLNGAVDISDPEDEDVENSKNNTRSQSVGPDRKTQSELLRLKKENEKLKRDKRDLSDEYERMRQEMLNKDKSRNAVSKQKVIMFYGSMPGVGTSTMALNTAVYLAMKKQKVVYIEFNDIIPTLSYWFDLSGIQDGLEKVFLGIETRNYQDITKAVITKSKILEQNSDMKEKHYKYPENLSYMIFSDNYIKLGEPNRTNSNTLKDLLLFMLYKEGYDYVILDVYSHSDFHILETASMFSSINVFVMTQDVVTIGSSFRTFANLQSNGLEFEALVDKKRNKDAVNFKNIYLVNKYSPGIKFDMNKVSNWLESKRVVFVPENTTDILNGLVNALPVVITKTNRQFLMSIKKLTDLF